MSKRPIIIDTDPGIDDALYSLFTAFFFLWKNFCLKLRFCLIYY